jgi:hypothetical protein
MLSLFLPSIAKDQFPYNPSNSRAKLLLEICTKGRPERQIKLANKPQFNKYFWDQLISHFRLIRQGPHRKPPSNNTNSSIVARVFVAVGYCLPSCCLATIRGIHITTHKQQSDLISPLSFFQRRKLS